MALQKLGLSALIATALDLKMGVTSSPLYNAQNHYFHSHLHQS